MKWKHSQKVNRSSVVGIVTAALTGFVLEMICCASAGLLLEKGSIYEDSINTVAILVQTLGVAATTIVAWVISSEDQKIKNASVSTGILLAVPILSALLLWGIDGIAFAIHIGASLAVFGLIIWILGRTGKRGVGPKQKRYYR